MESRGILVRPGSPSRLAEALITIIQDKELRRAFSAKARSRAVKLFSWSKVAERVVDTYLGLN